MKKLFAAALMLMLSTAAYAGVYEVERTGCKVDGEARWVPCTLVRIDGKHYFRDYGNANFDPVKAAKLAQAEFGYRFRPIIERDNDRSEEEEQK